LKKLVGRRIKALLSEWSQADMSMSVFIIPVTIFAMLWNLSLNVLENLVLRARGSHGACGGRKKVM